MPISKKDQAAIHSLAKEGKPISKILDEDFPEYEYWEIYEVVHAGGGKSALGAKRTIANRLITLSNSGKKQERDAIIEEIDDLVWHLYESLKTSQRKLDAIRKIISK
jgi:hypothetical protein